jgi:hypothetical protein
VDTVEILETLKHLCDLNKCCGNSHCNLHCFYILLDVGQIERTECRAQMKKAVTYKVDIAIDEHGSIYECHCECALGMGPNAHCKHVCCLLLALHNFSINGVDTVETLETLKHLCDLNKCCGNSHCNLHCFYILLDVSQTERHFPS